jgi:hypothetical protein
MKALLLSTAIALVALPAVARAGITLPGDLVAKMKTTATGPACDSLAGELNKFCGVDPSATASDKSACRNDVTAMWRACKDRKSDAPAIVAKPVRRPRVHRPAAPPPPAMVASPWHLGMEVAETETVACDTFGAVEKTFTEGSQNITVCVLKGNDQFIVSKYTSDAGEILAKLRKRAREAEGSATAWMWAFWGISLLLVLALVVVGGMAHNLRKRKLVSSPTPPPPPADADDVIVLDGDCVNCDECGDGCGDAGDGCGGKCSALEERLATVEETVAMLRENAPSAEWRFDIEGGMHTAQELGSAAQLHAQGNSARIHKVEKFLSACISNGILPRPEEVTGEVPPPIPMPDSGQDPTE